MHELIKASLENSFKVLNQNLVFEDDHSKLDIVINTLVKVINGSAYDDEIKNMFKNHPNINKDAIEKDVFNIVYLLAGRHALIPKCCENEHKELNLLYVCDLIDEIIDNLNCFIVSENGNITANQVDYISFKPEVPNLGELYITEPNNQS